MSLETPFEFTLGDMAPGALRVVSFRGREQLSAPYAFDITVAGTELDEVTFLDQAMGRPGRLVIHGPAGSRVVRGVVTRGASAGVYVHGRLAHRLRLSPRLATLEHRRQSRIFQDKTTPEIVTAVLDEAGIPHRWETRQKEPARSYCVQYEETDLAFVQRLLAEIGAFYRFEHPGEDVVTAEPEVLVFGDSPRYLPIDGEPKLLHRTAQPGVALALEEHHITRFHRSRRIAPAAYSRRDYDFARPLSPLEASAAVRGVDGEGEVYEHHGEFAEAEAEQRSETASLEQLRRKALQAKGQSACPRLLPGRKLTLREHELASHDGEYVVTSVAHEGQSPEIAGSAPTYQNRFSCVPADSVLRPARRERQFRQVMETAVVTGPEGQEIHTDTFGRIQVQFHWDRQGKRNERSSCWMRVAQAWAGSGWGFQFVPRVGMEVLVSFLGGDPDRPMVVGCVPNATHPVPYPLPENRTKSGIKTESVPGGGGFNELLFDDEKGGELVSLRAERNFTETVVNDHLQSVGRDQSVAVAGKRGVEVGGDDTLRVDGGQKWAVRGKSQISVGGSADTSVAGTRSAAIAGDDTTRVGGGHVVMAGAYSHVLVGQGVPEGHGMVLVNGNYRIGAAGEIQIGGTKGLTLTCGDSSITLLPGEIKIKSPKITTLATEEILTKGKEHEIAITDHVEIRGSDIRLFGKHGQLLLDDNARLNGQLIKLNCDRPKPENKSVEDSEEKGIITFRVQPHFELQPGDKLIAVIATPTGETVEREVDASMEVKLEGKKGDRFTLVDLRKGELPFGKRGA